MNELDREAFVIKAKILLEDIRYSALESQLEALYDWQEARVAAQAPVVPEDLLTSFGELIDTVEDILNDPDVCNVFKCHADYDDVKINQALVNKYLPMLKEPKS